jgi:hypothetical protein
LFVTLDVSQHVHRDLACPIWPATAVIFPSGTNGNSSHVTGFRVTSEALTTTPVEPR